MEFYWGIYRCTYLYKNIKKLIVQAATKPDCIKTDHCSLNGDEYIAINDIGKLTIIIGVLIETRDDVWQKHNHFPEKSEVRTPPA